MSQARLAWGAFKNMVRQAARDPLWAFVALLAAPFRIWKPLLGLLFLLVIVLFVVGFGGRFALEQMGFRVGSVPVLLLDLVTLLVLAASTILRAAALVARLPSLLAERRPVATSGSPVPLMRLPVVSLLVPMFREEDIAARLIARLGRIDYPRELLDVILVLEERDRQTHTALARADLPPWMRIVTVPDGPLRTKPRAMNFALDFARGSIVGVYDAEDAPHPDQINQIVRRFYEAPPDVACLQGVLDYYNARTNWLSRCFTVEYASWFRVILPGLQRLGLPLPLGGTTLFMRREALETLYRLKALGR